MLQTQWVWQMAIVSRDAVFEKKLSLKTSLKNANLVKVWEQKNDSNRKAMSMAFESEKKN